MIPQYIAQNSECFSALTGVLTYMQCATPSLLAISDRTGSEIIVITAANVFIHLET